MIDGVGPNSLWLVVLGFIRKQAEQAKGSKPLSSTLHSWSKTHTPMLPPVIVFHRSNGNPRTSGDPEVCKVKSGQGRHLRLTCGHQVNIHMYVYVYLETCMYMQVPRELRRCGAAGNGLQGRWHFDCLVVSSTFPPNEKV